MPDAQAAFHGLANCIENIAGRVRRAMDTDPAFKAKYTKNLEPFLFGAAHQEARAIARDVLEHEDQAERYGTRVQVADDEDLGSAADSQKDRDKSMGIKRRCFTPYGVRC